MNPKESAVVLDKRTEREKEEDDFWWEAFDHFCTFVKENLKLFPVLREPNTKQMI